VGGWLGRVGVRPEALSESAITTVESLNDPAAREAFLATLRGVVDIAGQRVSARGKLPSTQLPLLIVWGDRDAVLPVTHGEEAAALVEDGRLVIFPGAGHEPHRHDPERFAELLVEHAQAAVAR
jgi:pimeloyl-ACP methyl ester carboxylesterase